jgi:hypothetical protein
MNPPKGLALNILATLPNSAEPALARCHAAMIAGRRPTRRLDRMKDSTPLHPREELCLLCLELLIGQDAGVPQFRESADLLRNVLGRRQHG